jgi:hypothetical protein
MFGCHVSIFFYEFVDSFETLHILAYNGKLSGMEN